MKRCLYLAPGWGLGVLYFMGDDLVACDEPREGIRCEDGQSSPLQAGPLAGRLIAVLRGEVDDFEDVDCAPAIDYAALSLFEAAVVRAVRTIPRGETASYREIAELTGQPRAWRAAGTACGRGVLSVIVPYHRVIRSDGNIGEYGSGGSTRKRRLLALEGVR